MGNYNTLYLIHMKSHLLFLLLTFGTCVFAQHGTINIQTNLDSTSILQYSIDTLDSYQVGPGIIYTRFDITSNTGLLRHCYIYEVDLTNPYNTVEESHSTTMGNTERMVDAHARLDAPGHRSIGSVNCNFWITGTQVSGYEYGLTGVPCTGQVRNGKIGTNITTWNIGQGDPDPVFDRTQDIGYLMIDDQKRAHIDQYSWDAKIKIGEKTMTIREVNRNRKNPHLNEIVMFNSDMGTKATLTKDVMDTYLDTIIPIIEVMVKLDQEWVINQPMTGTIVSTNNTGGTKIPEGHALFRGRGKGKTLLETANIGDKVEFTIGMYESYSNERPNIMQLSAGNCYVMREGKLTNRNWNEDYNNKNYPRTGFGVSKDHKTLWMMVMEKPGMYTHEMASILRHFGAWEAAGADGGGSAQFNLGGQIINPTTEGVPRAVGNSIFLFSTAPDDNTVVEMRTTATFLRLPKYAAIKPDFLGYNQYGMLIDKQLQGVTLSCEPETGYITEDGQFVCLGSGILTATFDKASLPIQIVLVEEGNPSLRLDTILISNKTKYPIEVNGTLDGKNFAILPSSVEWTIDDPTICTINSDGILTGLANGTTNVHGILGNTTMHLTVRVEIIEQTPLRWEDMIAIENRWTLKTTSSAWKTSFNEVNGQAELYLNYTTGRQPHITLEADTLLYSTPQALEMRLIPAGDLIEKITITLKANNENDSQQFNYTSIVPDKTNSIYINLDTLFNVSNDPAIYPVSLDFIKFTLNAKATKQEYRIPIEGIYLHYAGENTETNVTTTPNPPTKTQKILHNGQLIIINNNKIYNILGHEITKKY